MLRPSSLAAGLVLAALAAAPATAPGGAAGTEPSLLEEHLLALLGHVPREATIVSHGPGAPPERTVGWAELRDMLAATSFGGRAPPPAPEGPAPPGLCQPLDAPAYCGPDAGYGHEPPAPFCDTSSAWIWYRGLPPGSAITESIVGQGPLPRYCSAFIGHIRHYDALELSSAKDPRLLASVAADGWEGCFSSVWTVHADGYCPNTHVYRGLGSGALDTFAAQWRMSGPALVLSMRFPQDYVLDLVIGMGGTTCYDLPPDVIVAGIHCP